MELKRQKLFTLVECITSKESGDFHNGNVECYDIEGENYECIVEKVINKYKARKEAFKNKEVYVDSCSWFEVDYILTTWDSTGNRTDFCLWSDSYNEHLNTYICKMKYHTTKRMKQQMLMFIEHIN